MEGLNFVFIVVRFLTVYFDPIKVGFEVVSLRCQRETISKWGPFQLYMDSGEQEILDRICDVSGSGTHLET